MHSKIIFYLLFFVLLYSSESMAQEYELLHYKLEDGLPSETIYHGIQDKEGYLWLGTENGLCRFDGNSFKVYDDLNLKDNTIIRLFEDQAGNLYFSNLSKELYSFNDGLATKFEAPFLDKTEIINNFIQYKDTYFISTEYNGVFYFNYQDGQPQLIKHFFPGELSNAMCRSEDGEIYLLQKWEAYYFKEGEFIQSGFQIDRLQLVLRSFSKGVVATNASNKDGMIHLQENKKTKVFSDFSDITDFKILKNGQYLIINLEAIYFLDHQHRLLRTIPLDDFEPNSLHIIEDKKGNIWLHGQDHGLYKIHNYNTINYNNSNSDLPSNHITNIIKYDDDHTLVTSNYGWLTVFKDNKVIKKFYLYDYIDGNFRKNDFYNLILNSDKTLSITFPYILIGEDITTDEPKFHTSEDIDLPLKIAKSFIKDSNNNYWTGHSNSVNYIANRKKEYILRQRTYHILESKDKNVWLGTTQGLFLANRDTAYLYKINNQTIEYSINHLKEDNNGAIWLATNDGVIRFKGNELKQYTTKEGLSSNICNYLSIDSKDNIWIATNKGISKLTAPNYNCSIIDENDGLKNKNTNTVYKNEKTNQIWVGSSEGVMVIDDMTKEEKELPIVKINKIKVNEIELPLKKKYELKYNENHIYVDFTSIYFNGKPHYRYKMKGVNKDFIEIEENKLRFPNLSPGTYDFQVYAVNKNGQSSVQPATFSIKIKPFWARSKTFIALLSIFIIATILALIYYRDHYLKIKQIEENKIAQKIAALELNTLQSQMNPHFIFNSLNAIQDFIIEKDVRSTNRYLSKFSKLIRAFLESSRSKFIYITEELKLLHLYLELEHLRHEASFDYHIIVDPNIDPGIVEIPAMLVQPFVENAVNHGLIRKNRGMINIEFKKFELDLIIRVIDNGIGIDASRKIQKNKNTTHISRALQILEERIQIINTLDSFDINYSITDLSNADPKASGTQVELIFRKAFSTA